MAYSDVHRLLLQSFMSQPVVEIKLASKIFNDICTVTGDVQREDVDCAIKKINKQIKPFSMEIRSATCEVTQKQFYVYINTLLSSVTRTMNVYSKNEQTLFRKIMEEIMKSEGGSVPSTVCVNLNISISKSLSKSHISSMIKKLIADSWLLEVEGTIYLSLHSILELEPFLKDVYSDFINYCPLCKQLAFKGYRCDSCDVLGHNHCLQKYTSASKSKPRCPNCKTVWNECPFTAMGSSTSGQTYGGMISSRELPLKKRIKISKQ